MSILYGKGVRAVDDAYQQMEGWTSSAIEVTILGEKDEDQAPPVQKTFYQLKPCPDNTHNRIYFNQVDFIAFPKNSEVHVSDHTFEAYDSESKLCYRVRKVNVERISKPVMMR